MKCCHSSAGSLAKSAKCSTMAALARAMALRLSVMGRLARDSSEIRVMLAKRQALGHSARMARVVGCRILARCLHAADSPAAVAAKGANFAVRAEVLLCDPATSPSAHRRIRRHPDTRKSPCMHTCA